MAFVIRYGRVAMPVDYAIVTLCAPLVWVAVFQASGTYYAQRLSEWEEFRRILTASSVAIIVAATASFWWKSSLSREWIALTWAIGLTLLGKQLPVLGSMPLATTSTTAAD